MCIQSPRPSFLFGDRPHLLGHHKKSVSKTFNTPKLESLETFNSPKIELNFNADFPLAHQCRLGLWGRNMG
jgi:hypothetical protein